MNSISKRVSAVLAFCCASLGIILICTMIRLAVQDSTTLPFWDQWLFTIQLAKQHGHYSLAELWQQHNEHRIVLLRLLLLADFHWFRATGHLLSATTFIIQFLHLLIFCRIVFWLEGISDALRVALCGVIAVFFFALGQLENFVWSFQVCFILVSFFSSLSFYFFVKSLNGPASPLKAEVNLKFFMYSLAAAVLATLSVASGLFVWPVLVYLCFVLRLNRRVVAATVAAAVVVAGVYLINYHSPATHANPLASLHRPLVLVHYLILYLGSSWAPLGTNAPTVAGSLGLVIAVLLLLNTTFRAASINRCELFCSAIAALTLIAGLITGSGRINFGIDQALSSRYQTFAMVFWSAIALWSVSIAARSTAREWITVLVAVASLLVAGVPLLKFRTTIGYYHERSREWRLAEAGVLSGVYDRAAMRAISLDVAISKPAVEYLRAHRLSIFAGNRYSQLGLPFSFFYQVNEGLGCEGAARALGYIREANESGAALSGWAWNASLGSAFENLVFVNEEGKISGFGSGGFFDSAKPSINGLDAKVQWFGYVRGEPSTTKAQAYGVLPDGKQTCPIGTAQAVSFDSFEPLLVSTHLLSNTRNGVFHAGKWRLDVDGDRRWIQGVDITSTFGQAGDIPVVGDWDGTGNLRIGVFRGGKWLMDMNGDRRWEPGADRESILGQPGDIPIVGDWDGTGKLRIGIFRNGQWWLDVNGDGKWDKDKDMMFILGQPGDIPVIGDWDGTGRLRIGIFRDGQWWLDVDGDRKWTIGRDEILNFGQRGDQPVIGDWNHSGKLKIGVFRNGHWLLDSNDNGNWDPGVDEEVTFGEHGDLTSLFQWPLTSGKK